jgi:tetratricopeptide (TPR) repeat protein
MHWPRRRLSTADEQVCTSTDDPNEIIAACSRLIEVGTQSPHDVGVDYDRRGTAYLHENQFGPAITDLTAAIQAIPNDANAYVDRADAEGNEGDVQAVLRDSGAVLQIDPKNSDALTNEANANLQLGYPRVWDVKLFDIQDNRDDVVSAEFTREYRSWADPLHDGLMTNVARAISNRIDS